MEKSECLRAEKALIRIFDFHQLVVRMKAGGMEHKNIASVLWLIAFCSRKISSLSSLTNMKIIFFLISTSSVMRKRKGGKEISIFLIFHPFARLSFPHSLTRHYFNVAIIRLDYIWSISQKCFLNIDSKSYLSRAEMRQHGGESCNNFPSFSFYFLMELKRKKNIKPWWKHFKIKENFFIFIYIRSGRKRRFFSDAFSFHRAESTLHRANWK